MSRTKTLSDDPTFHRPFLLLFLRVSAALASGVRLSEHGVWEQCGREERGGNEGRRC